MLVGFILEIWKNVACKHWQGEICSPGFWIGCVLDNEELEIATI